MAISARIQQTGTSAPISRIGLEPQPSINRYEGVRFFRGVLLAVSFSIPFWIAVLLDGLVFAIRFEFQVPLHYRSVSRPAPILVDAETTPLRDPEHYQYEFNLTDVAEVWRRGSVVASWVLDLTAAALVGDPQRKKFAGRMSDSGEGRWTIKASIDEAVPSPVLTASLDQRFSSRGEADFADKVLSAMRYAFGGHLEKAPEK